MGKKNGRKGSGVECQEELWGEMLEGGEEAHRKKRRGR